MSKQFVLGSADWLELQREGVFDRRPPVPAEPRRATEADEAHIFEASRRAFRAANERSHYPRPLDTPAPKGAGKPCAYCVRIMVPFTATHPTRDHVIPKSKGGRETVWCCTKCNNAKGDMMPDEWARFMRKFPEWWAVPGREAAGKRAIMSERKVHAERLTSVPKEYDDPKAQAAFEAVYRDRLHVLRAVGQASRD